MENLGLEYLIDKKVVCIYRLFLKEDDADFRMDDAFIIKLENNEMIEMLRDHNDVSIYKINSISEARVIGDYDPRSKRRLAVEIEFSKTETISFIYNYNFESSYFFGSRFLNFKKEFVTGFCFGFDEIISLTEEEFSDLLDKYDKKKTVIQVLSSSN